MYPLQRTRSCSIPRFRRQRGPCASRREALGAAAAGDGSGEEAGADIGGLLRTGRDGEHRRPGVLDVFVQEIRAQSALDGDEPLRIALIREEEEPGVEGSERVV